MKNSKSSNRKTNGNHKDNYKSGSKEQICDICAQNVPGAEREKIFAFGKCDHYVCYVCSTRLRVVCDQSDCPICREKLDSVVFSSNKNNLYEKYSIKDCLYNEKYKIYFETKAIKDAFDKLLKYECQECLKTNKQTTSNKKITTKLTKDEPQKSSSTKQSCCSGKVIQQKQGSRDAATSIQESDRGNITNQSSNCGQKNGKKTTGGDASSAVEGFEEDAQGLLEHSNVISNVFSDVFGLKNHLNYVHKLKLCDLCLTHNKLFAYEYSYYDNAALKKHMKEGEPKTSHRGHPNCVLCHCTFFNTDELIQHMSREHYHCHLCGRHDSIMRIYFLDYDGLRDHFKAKHYLCERENCRHEQFTSAFDNRIDYQLHMVQVHGNSISGLSRGEARHQRTITLDSAPHRARPVSPSRSMYQNLPPNAAVVSTGNIATANSSRQQLPESIQIQIRQQRLPTRSEFPALGHTSTGSTSRSTRTAPSLTINHYPSLTQTNDRQESTSSNLNQCLAGPSNSRGSFVRTLGGGYGRPEQLNELDFPPLPEQPKVKGNKKPRTQNSSHARNDDGGLTLDQLISTSLTLSNRNNRFNGKKTGSKGGSSKSNKSMKQKSIKIQLS